MKRLDELFEIRNGVAATTLALNEEPFEDADVALVRPSKRLKTAIAGWVSQAERSGIRVHPAGTLFVSTNGEGSHTYAYLSPVAFIPNSDVVALVAKVKMTDAQRHFYALAITKNRPKFSYARKPKGDRLGSILLPEPHELPAWLADIDLASVSSEVMSYQPPLATEELATDGWKVFKYVEIFDVTPGQGPYLIDVKDNPGDVPYVTRSGKNNGISAWTSLEATHPGGVLTVAMSGSPGECFYQPTPFRSHPTVAVLTPKALIDPEALLFVATLVRFEGKLKYGYSRNWTLNKLKDSELRLPVTHDGDPDWQCMARFVTRLPSYRPTPDQQGG